MSVEKKCVITIIKEQIAANNKLLIKFDADLKKCNIQLTSLKLKVSALQVQMTLIQNMYKDIMELRKIIVLLHPHLKKP